jgi:hypothetical protein
VYSVSCILVMSDSGFMSEVSYEQMHGNKQSTQKVGRLLVDTGTIVGINVFRS